MKGRSWSTSSRSAWKRDLAFVVRTCFADWPNARHVDLIFSSRIVPSVFALCDPPSASIGLFPLARRLGSIARRETLIHECCHIRTGEYHSRAWKRRMRQSAQRARSVAQHRLASMLERDVQDYSHRPVEDAQVLRQMKRFLNFCHDKSYPNVLRLLADWAGWTPHEFSRQFPEIRSAWRGLATKA